VYSHLNTDLGKSEIKGRYALNAVCGILRSDGQPPALWVEKLFPGIRRAHRK
jgi:hypothetical protein